MSVEYERTALFYDLHVPGEEHYLADGIWSHNTGKSLACLHKVHLTALMNPGCRILIIRKTATSLSSTGLVTWRTRVVPEALAAGMLRFYGGSAAEPPQYRYRNGSTIVIGGMDRAIRIMSSEYDLAYVQEATELTSDDWESITTRLRYGRVSYQQIMADANPAQPTHWLKVRCDTGRTVLLESRHEDNPTLFDETGQPTEGGAAYLAKLDALTGVRYLRLRKGLWAAAEGLVYDEWDPVVHHAAQWFPIPRAWPRYWGVDFGYVNPMTVQMWAINPDGRLVLYRELYHTGRTVDQFARDVMAVVSRAVPGYLHPVGEDRYAYHGRDWKDPKPVAIVCDHDAEGRAVLERELGCSTTAAHKSVLEGIQAVQARLRPGGDGRVRLSVMPDCLVRRDPGLAEARKPTCLREEVLGYVWDTGAGKKPKEAPVKMDDHGCDTMRYVVAEIDLGARPRVRWM